MFGRVNPIFDPQPITLTGRMVRLEPLQRSHAAALFTASQYPEVWRWMPVPMFASVTEVEAWIDEAHRLQAGGSDVPFVTVRIADGAVVGSTRFLDIRRPHRGLEIGWTWITPAAQRTPVNTEAKYLMLCQAFEGWGAMRVQLKTDSNNAKSRAAILRIGASFEGIIRKQMLRAHDNYERDSAMFSIIRSEWPDVKARLDAKLKG